MSILFTYLTRGPRRPGQVEVVLQRGPRRPGVLRGEVVLLHRITRRPGQVEVVLRSLRSWFMPTPSSQVVVPRST